MLVFALLIGCSQKRRRLFYEIQKINMDSYSCEVEISYKEIANKNIELSNGFKTERYKLKSFRRVSKAKRSFPMDCEPGLLPSNEQEWVTEIFRTQRTKSFLLFR